MMRLMVVWTAFRQAGLVVADALADKGPAADTPGGKTWLLAGGVATALCLLGLFARRWIGRRYAHRALFGNLCRIHGLGPGERKLLRRIQQHCRLAEPARLFTEPNWLSSVQVASILSVVPGGLEQLRGRLFGPSDTPRKEGKEAASEPASVEVT
ncbi:MAG: hypothetical protein ACUVUC_01345 [Thermoguttaceae bacterium]